MSIVDKLQRAKPEHVYAIAIILCIISAVVPFSIGEPIVPDRVRLAYDAIESLKPGSLVIYSADTNAAFYAEYYGAMFAAAKHLASKPVKIIFVGFWEDGPVILKLVLKQIDSILTQRKAQYGVDYVELGYVPGFEAGYAAFSRNPKQALRTDYYGTPIEQIPLMKDFNSANDISLWIQSGSPGTLPIIRQYSAPFKKGNTLITIAELSWVASLPVYQQQGGVLTALCGVPDGAAYEKLTNVHDIGYLMLNALNILPTYAILLLVVGNMTEYLLWSRGRKGGK